MSEKTSDTKSEVSESSKKTSDTNGSVSESDELKGKLANSERSIKELEQKFKTSSAEKEELMSQLEDLQSSLESKKKVGSGEMTFEDARGAMENLKGDPKNKAFFVYLEGLLKDHEEKFGSRLNQLESMPQQEYLEKAAQENEMAFDEFIDEIIPHSARIERKYAREKRPLSLTKKAQLAVEAWKKEKADKDKLADFLKNNAQEETYAEGSGRQVRSEPKEKDFRKVKPGSVEEADIINSVFDRSSAEVEHSRR